MQQHYVDAWCQSSRAMKPFVKKENPFEKVAIKQPSLPSLAPSSYYSQPPVMQQPVMQQPVMQQPVVIQQQQQQAIPQYQQPIQPALQQPVVIQQQAIPQYQQPIQPVMQQPALQQPIIDQQVLQQQPLMIQQQYQQPVAIQQSMTDPQSVLQQSVLQQTYPMQEVSSQQPTQMIQVIQPVEEQALHAPTMKDEIDTYKSKATSATEIAQMMSAQRSDVGINMKDQSLLKDKSKSFIETSEQKIYDNTDEYTYVDNEKTNYKKMTADQIMQERNSMT